MHLYHLRRMGFIAIIFVSLAVIGGIWINRIALYNAAGHDAAHLDAVLATAVQTTSAVGGLALALIFLTAQLSAAKASLLRELYRSGEVYVLLCYFVTTLLLGYAALSFLPAPGQGSFDPRIVDTVLVLAGTSVVLVIPAVMMQLENLNPATLASKLAERIRPRTVMEYGLTNVRLLPGDPGRIEYHLITVGLRPREVDPFRPMHEVLMDAVNARDRVLFGKLFRHLLIPIAVVHGAAWNLSGLLSGDLPGSSVLRRLLARRYTFEERVHLTLAILHYSVKRARNLRTEWDGRDTGRHGILTGLEDLIRCLGPVRDAEVAISLVIHAALHISEYYADIPPFGRIEPFNSYFETADRLAVSGKAREAELCVAMLGWVSVHTKQLSAARSPEPYNNLSEGLRETFFAAQEHARRDEKWLPSFDSDPWRKWLI